jgi:hypothetical protein
MLGGARHSGGIRDVDDNIRTLDDIERNVTHAILGLSRCARPRQTDYAQGDHGRSRPLRVVRPGGGQDEGCITRQFFHSSELQSKL